MHEEIVKKWLGIIDAAVEMKDGARVGFTSGQIEEALVELQLGDDQNPPHNNGPLSLLKRAIIQDGRKTLGLEPLPEGQGEDEKVVARRVGLMVLTDEMHEVAQGSQRTDLLVVQYELARRLLEQNPSNRFTTEADPLKSDAQILAKEVQSGGQWQNFALVIATYVGSDMDLAWVETPSELAAEWQVMSGISNLSTKAKALLEYERTQIETTRAAWAKRQGDMAAHKTAMQTAYAANVAKVRELEAAGKEESHEWVLAHQEVARCAMDGGVEGQENIEAAVYSAYDAIRPIITDEPVTEGNERVIHNVLDRLSILQESKNPKYREFAGDLGTALAIIMTPPVPQDTSEQLGTRQEVAGADNVIPQTGAPFIDTSK